jgi:hypothetical protein
MSHSSRQQTRSAQKTSWAPVRCPPGKLASAYFEGLRVLYWEGVQRDVEDIMKALQAWSTESGVEALPTLPDYSAESQELQGFGTFLSKAAGGGVAEM